MASTEIAFRVGDLVRYQGEELRVGAVNGTQIMLFRYGPDDPSDSIWVSPSEVEPVPGK